MIDPNEPVPEDWAELIQFFEKAGLREVAAWRANQHKDWSGTLALTGKK